MADRRWLFRGLWVVYLLALVLLLELGLRLFAPIPTPKGMYYPPTWLQRSDNPAKGYEPRPGAAGHNSAGFRGPELPLERSPGVGRVAVLGDSVAWGLGVEPNQAYAALLPSLLEARTAQPWEAYNMGVPGYGTVQIVEHFRERGLAYDPDVVVYGYWFNDFHQFGCNEYHFPFFSGMRAAAWELYVQVLLRWPSVEGFRDAMLGSQIMLRGVDLRYRLQTRGWRDRSQQAASTALGTTDPDMERFYASWTRTTDGLASRADVEFLDAFLMEHHGRSAQQSFRDYWAAMTELRALCEARDIRLLVVATPVLRDLQDYDYHPLHTWLAATTRHMDIALLDTLPAFQAADYRTPTPPPGEPIDVAHPTPQGHRIVAEALADRLSERDAER